MVQTTLSRLERLPPEITTMILNELNGIKTLMNAIRASRVLWEVYKESQSNIARRVLFNELDILDVRDAALWTLEIRALPAMDQLDFTGYFQFDFYGRGVDYCPSLSLDEIGLVHKLHETVVRFLWMYVSKVGTVLGPVTLSEAGRIARALYYLEMYFNCARTHSMQEPEAPELDLDCLLWKFAPWENEQMICLWEFLYRLGKAFKRMKGEFNDAFFERKMWKLAFGRRSPHNIPYQGLRRLTLPPQGRRITSLLGNCMWRWHLQIDISELGMYGEPHSSQPVSSVPSPQYWDTHLKELFYSEPDDGPFLTWQKAYWNYVPEESIYGVDAWHRYVRTGGWYFWDRRRIEIVSKRILEMRWSSSAVPAIVRIVPFEAVWRQGTI